MHKFNRSIDTWGRPMYKADIKQSMAYSKALKMAGILTDAELAEMHRGLKLVEAEWASGKVRVMAVYRATQLMGSLRSKQTTRTSSPRTSGVCPRSSARTSAASCTPAEAEMTKQQPTRGSGW